MLSRRLLFLSLATAPIVGLMPASDLARAADPYGGQDGRWAFRVGALGLTAPKYEGSDEHRFLAVPLIIPKYYGDDYDPNAISRFTFRGIDDVRYAALRFGNFDLGPVVGYTFGRDEDDADRLDGIGDVDGGLILGAYAALRFDPFFVDGAISTPVTGDSQGGFTGKLGFGAEYDVNERLTFSPYLSTTYASGDYMDDYFSISSAQSAASTAGLATYDAEGGIKDVSFEFGTEYRLTERWTAIGSAGYSRLIGDAADSPVTASKDQFTATLGLTYTFGRTD